MKNEMVPAYGGNMKVSMSEVPARSDTTVMLNLYGNMNFSCIDHSNLQQHNKDQYYGFAIPPADHQSGLSSIMTAKRLDYHHDAAAAAVAGYRPEPKYCNYGDDDHHHDSVLTQSVLPFPKKRFVLHFNDINKAIRNPRKRPPHAEVTHDHKEDSMVMVTGSNKVVDHSNQWKTQKKMPAVRRSQKLGDKITALQKLVSPYGKTDTASVLEEAYISIKFLQDQIQNLIWKLSSSSTDVLDIGSHKHQKTEERQHALRIRGMCLVPVPFHTKDSRTLQEQLINQRLVSEELCIRSQTIKSHTA